MFGGALIFNSYSFQIPRVLCAVVGVYDVLSKCIYRLIVFMIIIFSQSVEHTTREVIDWIDYNGIKFKRVNGTNFCEQFAMKLSAEGLILDLQKIEWSQVQAVWFWRWVGFEERHASYFKQDPKALDPVKSQLNHFLKAELKTLVGFFFDSLPKKKMFSRIGIEELNKLIVLKKAQEFGIEIPNTFVTTKRVDVENIAAREEIITKAISNAPMIDYENQVYNGYTAVVDSLPARLTDTFAASLFQNKVDKKYEIRSFLIGRKFYSMAIFSQSDQQTSVDFRMYNYVYPNRKVPFKLPQSLEEKLLKLADHFDLETASFDIIKTTDNRYVFLEINCSGQFGMVSYPCNYYLEKKMALALINHNKNENS
jgi:ATP-GRASP peptide maturase of grasp-with-spasm system